MRQGLWLLVTAGVFIFTGPGRACAEVTDEDVSRAIEKGREFLINQQRADGSWEGQPGYSALVFMTLAYMGEHPNREVMTKGLNYLIRLDPDKDMNGLPGSPACRGYTVPIRVMGLSYIHNKLLGEKRATIRAQIQKDLKRILDGQTDKGGWRYALEGQDFDFSVSQWPILAIREASLIGIELPPEALAKILTRTRDLYYEAQNPDGGWFYQLTGGSYGSMTAAGLASLFIISDILEPGSGCPCQGGRSQRAAAESERRIDAALLWLSQNFDATQNPNHPGFILYWLYCVERVGIAAGYKYFGQHHWYKEGAEVLLKTQQPNGCWGSDLGTLPGTCFALLFLYKGRAPVLFNKLQFEGAWNSHRRDIANLTQYVERTKEQMFHWQIVNLQAPLEELHDAPILYITAESKPEWTEEEKNKLRAFTDTGGTILFEASCGNPNVRRWFTTRFVEEVWPEWKKLTLLPRDHEVWNSVYQLKTKRPEIWGLHDGIRTFLFYSPDDISCPWHMKAYASKGYLFNWGINLYTYATDGAPLRAKLAGREPQPSNRYAQTVKAGDRTRLRIARVKHSGDWATGANYGGFRRLTTHLEQKARIALEVEEATQPPFTDRGVAPANLSGSGYDAAYIVGRGAFTFEADERDALKAYVASGGFLWLEAAMGSTEFDQSVKQFAEQMGWDVRLLPQNHPLLTGQMEGATGYNLTAEVQFRRSLRVPRLGRQYAELSGLYDGASLIGIYSPFDVLFSLNPYEAWDCRGYQPEDAEAVASNIVLFLTTRPAPAGTPTETPPASTSSAPEEPSTQTPEPESEPSEEPPAS